MKYLLLVLSLLLFSTKLLAVECKPEGSQIEMNQCAYDDFLKADKALNDTYQALVKKSAGDKTYIKMLRKAQRAWIVFRDAELDAMFSCADKDIKLCWGSMVGLLHPSAKTEITRERTKKLQHYIDNGQNDSGE